MGNRGSTWLKSATPQDTGAGLFYRFSRLEKLFFTLHGTGSRHDYDAFPPNLNPIDGNQAILGFKFPRRQLVGLHNPGYALYTGEHGEDIRGQLAGIATSRATTVLSVPKFNWTFSPSDLALCTTSSTSDAVAPVLISTIMVSYLSPFTG